MAEMHWAASLIGKPYAERGRGPDAFDCWGVPQFCWRLRRGWQVPDLRESALQLFRDTVRRSQTSAGAFEANEVARPVELDAVYMTQIRLPHHIGVWVTTPGRAGVLHAYEGAGVVFQTLTDLQVFGFHVVKYMRLSPIGAS